MGTINEKQLILGCDIGNGYGYVSILSNSQEDPMPLFPSSYGLTNFGMPTTAYVMPPEGEPIEVFQNGKPAEVKYVRTPKQFVRAVKTRLKEGEIFIPNVNKPIKVNHIYSAIARDLILLAQEELANKAMKPVYDIVFTFPAAFSDDAPLLEEMQQSIENIVINGKNIHVCGRLPEPAAVAIDYLHYMQHLAPEDVRISEDNFTVLVYDLGHGTFDTAVVTAQSKGVPYKLHSKAGLPEVGGKNFDEVLYNEICLQLKNQYDYIPQNERKRKEIRDEAINAKIALSKNTSYTASVLHEDDYCYVDISRSRFEELSEHLIFQTLELVQSVLDDAKNNGIKIDGIVLSGGASNMPMVRNNLEQLVEGEYPIVLYRPSEAVSFGASRFAFGISQVKPKSTPKQIEQPKRKGFGGAKLKESNQVLEQLTDCCYGIWLPTEEKLEGEIRFMIGSGVKRPAASSVVTFYSSSSRVVVKLYRSKEKNKTLETASIEECESILWIPFDVKPGAKYDVRITVLENYGVEVELQSDKGDNYRKTTSDLLKNLI